MAGVFFYNANIVNAYADVRTAERRVKSFEVKYKPLATLPLERTRPGKEALDEIMESLR